MRLLFLTNLYPPYSQGGYEEWCQEVAVQLRHRGHDVIVLTSQHGSAADEIADPSWVRRELYLEMELASLRNGLQFFTARQQRARENLETLRSHVRRLQPDFIVVWGMWNIVRSLPTLAEKLLPGRVIYYMGDYWPTLPSQFEYYWKAPAQYWYTHLPKSILRFFANAILSTEVLPMPQFERVIFPTIFMRNELVKRGIQPKESIVIYGAADTAPYFEESSTESLDQHCNGDVIEISEINQNGEITHPPDRSLSLQVEDGNEQGNFTPAHEKETATAAPSQFGQLTLLWAGRLRSDKGAHTAIKALARLVKMEAVTNIELLIAGSGEPDYRIFLEYLVRKERIEPYVTFLGHQEKEAMPTLYQQADIFLFTSVWQEPFGRVLIEAMAAGTVVIGSTVGGVAEILVGDENSLTFPPGDDSKLATKVVIL